MIDLDRSIQKARLRSMVKQENEQAKKTKTNVQITPSMMSDSRAEERLPVGERPERVCHSQSSREPQHQCDGIAVSSREREVGEKVFLNSVTLMTL